MSRYTISLGRKKKENNKIKERKRGRGGAGMAYSKHLIFSPPFVRYVVVHSLHENNRQWAHFESLS